MYTLSLTKFGSDKLCCIFNIDKNYLKGMKELQRKKSKPFKAEMIKTVFLPVMFFFCTHDIYIHGLCALAA